MKQTFKKGERIRVTNDSILAGCMGIPVATGKVFTVTTDGTRILGFQCDQTGAIEGIDNGKVEKI
jgi:hypothetical protein